MAWIAAALIVAGLAAALAVLAAQAAGGGRPRCYWLNPPITRLQPGLLKRGLLDCGLPQCQLTLRQSPDAGWVCFFERPWGQPG